MAGLFIFFSTLEYYVTDFHLISWILLVNVLKFHFFFFCSQIECWLSGLEFTKCLSEYLTGKTLIRLLLFCLSRPFWQTTSVQNFPISTVSYFQSDDAYNPDRMYDLVAVVVHIGSSINRGHYISIVKSEDIWILFDDDIVDVSKPFTGQLFLEQANQSNSFIPYTVKPVLRGYIFQKLLLAWNFPVYTKIAYWSRRQIPLATLLYEQFIHLT